MYEEEHILAEMRVHRQPLSTEARVSILLVSSCYQRPPENTPSQFPLPVVCPYVCGEDRSRRGHAASGQVLGVRRLCSAWRPPGWLGASGPFGRMRSSCVQTLGASDGSAQ